MICLKKTLFHSRLEVFMREYLSKTSQKKSSTGGGKQLPVSGDWTDSALGLATVTTKT